MTRQRRSIPTYPLSSFDSTGRRIPTYPRLHFRGVTVVTVVTTVTVVTVKQGSAAVKQNRRCRFRAKAEASGRLEWLTARFEVEFRRLPARQRDFFFGERRGRELNSRARKASVTVV